MNEYCESNSSHLSRSLIRLYERTRLKWAMFKIYRKLQLFNVSSCETRVSKIESSQSSVRCENEIKYLCFILRIRRPPTHPLFPNTPLVRSITSWALRLHRAQQTQHSRHSTADTAQQTQHIRQSPQRQISRRLWESDNSRGLHSPLKTI